MDLQRRRFLEVAFVTGVAAPLVGTGAAVAAQAPQPENQPRATDKDLDVLLAKLESLPPHLRNADPATYPNYEAELRAHIDGKPATNSDVAQPAFNAFACAAAIVPLIVEYGIPVGKVVGWIRRAREIWGGVRGIWAAIRSGAAAAEIGEDAVKVLEGILGVGGVVNACSL